MGCGAAKAVQTSDDKNNSNGNTFKDSVNGVNHLNDTNDVTHIAQVPKPVAFDVPLDEVDNTGGGVQQIMGAFISDNGFPIRKLPPKRLLTLVEHQSQSLTAKQILEKQLRAEEKRLELLAEKKNKCRIYNEKFLPTNYGNNTNNNIESHSHNNSNGIQQSITDKIKNNENVSETIRSIVENNT